MKLIATTLVALLAPTGAWAATTPCDGLVSMPIPATRIGMPTSGAVVTSAHLVDKGSKGAQTGAYCMISGTIAPVDKAAPPIHFDLALPADWNQKIVMLGGSGFEGSIPDVTEPILALGAGVSSPLARGYAVLADDGGHKDPGMNPGAFLLNDEAYRNWMGDALKKTRDAAMVILRSAYGAAPQHAYFLGGSTGGREGLIVAGRWPGDWDGVVSLYPARNSLSLVLGGMAMGRALAAPGAWPDPARRQLLFDAAVEACDAMDGVADGIISNVRGCNAAFKPRSATFRGKPIRCVEGKDTGDTCLTDAQFDALDRINASFRFGAPLANGQDRYPGANVFLSESGTPGAPVQGFVSMLSLGNAAPAFPATPAMSFATIYVDNFVRFAIARDPAFNPLTLDPQRLGRYAARVRALSAIEDVDSDLSSFAAHGGKLLIAHGTADLLVTPRGTQAYVADLTRRMGAARVGSFLRFYEIPGFGHGVSDNFNAGWDGLAALEGWVERGIDPARNQIVTDMVGVPGRTRPLCLYPSWPHYRGTGDVNSAASFTCASQQADAGTKGQEHD